MFQDSKGLRQYIMDVVGGGSSNSNGTGNGSNNGMSQHKLIGSVEIPIKEIPASGLNKWWPLEKLDNKVNISFSPVPVLVGRNQLKFSGNNLGAINVTNGFRPGSRNFI